MLLSCVLASPVKKKEDKEEVGEEKVEEEEKEEKREEEMKLNGYLIRKRNRGKQWEAGLWVEGTMA